MKLLDLFCGAGGASMGYWLAGFEVYGCDIRPQPRYPFPFLQASWEQCPLEGFDVIHASPPCQFASAGAAAWGRDHPNLIPAVRQRLEGRSYVIENIPSAKPWLRQPIMLCGQTFGLGVFRHRLFEVNGVKAPDHQPHNGRIGDGRYHTVAGHSGGSSTRDGWQGGTVAQWRLAMGIEWMTMDEIAQAIPPAYTEWIGRQLISRPS